MTAVLETAPAGERLASDLRAFCGNAKPHQTILAERRLAKQYGISHGTVRRVLDELATEGLIYRVHGKGTFVAPSRDVRQRPAVIYADTLRTANHPFFVHRLQGMMVAAEELELRLEVLHLDLHLSNPGRLVAELAREEVRGVVLPWIGQELLREVRRASPDLAMVLTAASHPPPGACSVVVDYAALGKMAVEYLAGRGARRPICVLAHRNSRLGVEAGAEHCCPTPLIVEVDQVLEPDIAAAVAGIRHLTGDGLLFDDDQIAKAVLAELGETALPIVSHANRSIAALPPHAARLEVDGEVIGRELLYLLHDRIESRDRPDVQLNILPRLIEPHRKE